VKQGVVDRVEEQGGGPGGGVQVIGRGLFKKEVDMSQFAGLRVSLGEGGPEGVITGAFGKSGKFKVCFPATNSEQSREGSGGGGGEGAVARSLTLRPGDPLLLKYRKFMFGADGGKGRLSQI